MVDYSKIEFGYHGGTFSEKELEMAQREKTPLTLDMAIPCSCLNKCYYCGYKDTQEGDKLSKEEIFSVIEQFKEIGGKSIKILGEGEPLLRKDIFEIFEHIHKIGLIPVLFTCGDVLGNNNLTKEIHGITAKEVIQKLKNCNATIMLKYEKKNEDSIVGKKGFSKKRNIALERLLSSGFNKFSPTHLGFGIVVLKENHSEIAKVYEMALKQNIYPLLCPLMPIGKAQDSEWRKEIGISAKQMVEMAKQLYSIAKKRGVKPKCAADFPGGLPCDVARAGFYIADTGKIYLCEDEEYVGTVREMNLKEAWKKIFEWKNQKYGKERWSGKCCQKRKIQVIPETYDAEVAKGIFNKTKRD
ncbi:MAG: radical SAM protein [Candidatus ainarchaeum sp.]|nr:radical SAM protein [Candidatus ainarchaeum sp.]